MKMREFQKMRNDGLNWTVAQFNELCKKLTTPFEITVAKETVQHQPCSSSSANTAAVASIQSALLITAKRKKSPGDPSEQPTKKLKKQVVSTKIGEDILFAEHKTTTYATTKVQEARTKQQNALSRQADLYQSNLPIFTQFRDKEIQEKGPNANY